MADCVSDMQVKSLIQPPSLYVAAVAILAGAVIQSLPPDMAAGLTAETGPFEIFSAVCYAIGALLAVTDLVRQASALRLTGCLLLVWAFLRELDFQKRFTYRSMESLGYYTRPIAPIGEKLLVLAIMLPFVLAGCYLLRALVKDFGPALKRGEPWPGHLAVCVGLGLVSGVQEKILHWGAAEEVCEAGLASNVVLLVWSLRPLRAVGASELPKLESQTDANLSKE